LDIALAIARDVSAAVEFVHRQGFIRLDLKPNNILLNRDGHTYLTDFGVIRKVSSAGSSVTQSGFLIGTPAYVSPEQAVGGPIDVRTDIYSFGVVLYEMLAGQPPFVNPNQPVDVLYAHINREPPPLPDTIPTRTRRPSSSGHHGLWDLKHVSASYPR
jgi:serine/threonine protein kinase